MNIFNLLSFAGLAIVLLFSSCSSYQQQAEVIDDLSGPGAGSASGNEYQNAIAGAVGSAFDSQNKEDLRQYERYGITPDQPEGPPPRQGIQDPRGELGPAPKSTPAAQKYPVARRTSKPDEVESPYPPNHRINVSGFRSGQLAKDPKNGKIFRVP